jgi:hypothetical protein
MGRTKDSIRFDPVPPGFEGPPIGFGGHEIERDENGFRLNNNADISGLVDDEHEEGENPSDYINRQRGAALEGEVSEHYPPQFVRLNVAQDPDEAPEETGTIYFDQVQTPAATDHIPGDCPAGWIAGLDDIWYPVDTIRRLQVDGCEVRAYLDAEQWFTCARFASADDARDYRGLLANRIAWARGLVVEE